MKTAAQITTLLAGAALLLMVGGGQTLHAKTPDKSSDDSSQDDTDSDDAARPARQESEHIVKPGETLAGIAYRARVPRVLIEEANHLKPPYVVHTGQRLFLPRTRHHTVRAGETGFDISMRYGIPFPAIAVANGLKSDASLTPGQKLLIPTLIPTAKGRIDKTDKAGAGAGRNAPDDGARVPGFLWPVAGRVVRGFAPLGQADHHDGLDIAAAAGTPVYASAGGEVIFAGEEPQSFGKLVVLSHADGWQSAYGFLGKLTVSKGDTVRAHERIGLVGHTGKAPRDELHFEIRKADKPVDPKNILPDRADTAAGHEVQR